MSELWAKWVNVPHENTTKNYVRPRNKRTEMYAGRVGCCPLMSHVQYVPRALLS